MSEELEGVPNQRLAGDSAATPKSAAVVRVGGFVVERSSWGRYCTWGPVVKMTPKLALVASGYGRNRTLQIRLGDVLFAGAEAACNALVERLESSRTLAAQERRSADARHDARAVGLIAKATQTSGQANVESAQ